ncbi:MAG: hypothetical protein J0I20_01000 [Chloroflexi bacterium]|nr:hypothetical protein [Chloroflexota bacterium]
MRTLDQAPDYFGDAAHFATIDPIILAQTKNLNGLKIWIDIGLQDNLWIARAAEMHQVLLNQNVPHQWHEWPGDHSGDYWAPHLVDYLQFYASSFNY